MLDKIDGVGKFRKKLIHEIQFNGGSDALKVMSIATFEIIGEVVFYQVVQNKCGSCNCNIELYN
jgi:hypothetical protein